MEHEIPQADISIKVVAKIQTLDDGDRHFAPDFNHTRQEAASLDMEASVEPDGECDGLGFVGDLELGEMSPFQGHRELVAENSRQIDAEEGEKLVERCPIDDAEAEKLVDAGNRIGVLNLREPTVRDLKIVVPFILRNFPA